MHRHLQLSQGHRLEATSFKNKSKILYVSIQYFDLTSLFMFFRRYRLVLIKLLHLPLTLFPHFLDQIRLDLLWSCKSQTVQHLFVKMEKECKLVLIQLLFLIPVCVTPQSQQPLGNLDAELRRALSPETVQGGNRVQPPAAGFTLGRFQVSLSHSFKCICLFQSKTGKPLKCQALLI